MHNIQHIKDKMLLLVPQRNIPDLQQQSTQAKEVQNQKDKSKKVYILFTAVHMPIMPLVGELNLNKIDFINPTVEKFLS